MPQAADVVRMRSGDFRTLPALSEVAGLLDIRRRPLPGGGSALSFALRALWACSASPCDYDWWVTGALARGRYLEGTHFTRTPGESGPEIHVAVVHGAVLASSTVAAGREAARLIGEAFSGLRQALEAGGATDDAALSGLLDRAAELAAKPVVDRGIEVRMRSGELRTVLWPAEVPAALALRERAFGASLVPSVSIRGLWGCTLATGDVASWFGRIAASHALLAGRDYVGVPAADGPDAFVDVLYVPAFLSGSRTEASASALALLGDAIAALRAERAAVRSDGAEPPVVAGRPPGRPGVGDLRTIHGVGDARSILAFDFEGSAVRVVVSDGQPWFVQADICALLGRTNASLFASLLEDGERAVCTVGAGSSQRVLHLTSEGGVLALIVASGTPRASALYRWLMREVLPIVRRMTSGDAGLTAPGAAGPRPGPPMAAGFGREDLPLPLADYLALVGVPRASARREASASESGLVAMLARRGRAGDACLHPLGRRWVFSRRVLVEWWEVNMHRVLVDPDSSSPLPCLAGWSSAEGAHGSDLGGRADASKAVDDEPWDEAFDFGRLVPVTRCEIGGKAQISVIARDVHTFIGSADDFPTWFKDQVARCSLSVAVDYEEVFREKPENPRGGRPRRDYALTLAAAKKVAMAASGSRGNAVREYFIEQERRLLAGEPPLPGSVSPDAAAVVPRRIP